MRIGAQNRFKAARVQEFSIWTAASGRWINWSVVCVFRKFVILRPRQQNSASKKTHLLLLPVDCHCEQAPVLLDRYPRKWRLTVKCR